MTDKTTPENIDSLMGEEFKGYKGKNAIVKLLVEKRRHIKSAFYRKVKGNIDLLWGDDIIGLHHIKKRRKNDGIDVAQFLSTLADTIKNGSLQQVFRQDRQNGLFTQAMK